MKKVILEAFALAAVLSGCVKDELTNGQDTSIDMNAPVFHAGFADASSETKTYVNENGHLRWNADDRLTIFVGKTLNTQYAFDGEDGDNAGGFNPIADGGGFVTANPLNANYAVYPYSSTTKISEEGVISLSLPSVQTYGEDSFGRGANTMIAVTQGTDDFYLPFKNVCGYLVVSLYGDATITSVSLEGNNEEKLAGAATVTPSFGGNPSLVMKDTATGTITVDCGEGVMLGTTKETATAFWFVVPQTTFSNGITITATSKDGESFQKATSKTITIERNKISSMAALEYEANYGNINFEDANFKAYCVENFDKDGDGEVSYAEAREVKRISCSYRELKSLKGIEFFTKLESLFCGSNQLSSLNVSKNTALTYLSCKFNQLTSLDVSKNTALTDLSCGSNQLTSLDVSKNTALTDLSCGSNQLTSLDVSKNTALQGLSCSSNQLTSLDVSKNTALTSLGCESNQLTSLDVSKNTALTSLGCESNQLSSLDVSKNTALTSLGCESNQLASLDVSKNTALQGLNCESNQLSSLDVSNNTALESLVCSYNQLTSLDVSGAAALTYLRCYSNQLASLDVSNNTALELLVCSYNQLTSLDVSKNTALTSLGCGSNQLTSLDVSGATALTCLNCESNQLASLDVSKNKALAELFCYSNQLTSLDVSKNTELYYLRCSPMATLKTLYISTGQSIDGVTKKRNSDNVPDATEIVVVASVPVPEAIDLGLPSGIKWASFNLGASSPEEYGDYYAWGETETKTNYSLAAYKFYKSEHGYGAGFTKYIPKSKADSFGFRGFYDDKGILDIEDDVAYVELGGKWRMPTNDEFEELLECCDCKWTTQNGTSGRKFTSKKNGNSIFLPAAGSCNGDGHYGDGDRGIYWSSSLGNGDSDYARVLSFTSLFVDTIDEYRSDGRYVRPVIE